MCACVYFLMGEAVIERVKEACVGLIIGQRERERESRSYPISTAAEQNAMAGPLLTATRPPCLSVEGTGAVLDHFPCIDQSKWNDLSGTQA